MIQRHNRHMSISYYISVLAVTDTIALLIGGFRKAFTVRSKELSVAVENTNNIGPENITQIRCSLSSYFEL